MTELWNIRASREDTERGNDISITNIQYGSMQKFMNDRSNEGYTKFTVWRS